MPLLTSVSHIPFDAKGDHTPAFRKLAYPNVNIANALHLLPERVLAELDVIDLAIGHACSQAERPARVWAVGKSYFGPNGPMVGWSVSLDSEAQIEAQGRMAVPCTGTIVGEDGVESEVVATEIVVKFPDGFVFVTRYDYLKSDGGWGDDSEAPYQIYMHTVRDKPYIGITKQTWQKRWNQHANSAAKGSKYLFHDALRRHPLTGHYVIASGLTFEEAMDNEEALVESTSLYPKGLNMIPGGFAGIRYLHKLGALSKQQILNPRIVDRSQAITNFTLKAKRENRVNPLAAALWQDADFRERVICNNPNNFSAADVRHIRLLDSRGVPVNQIAEEMNANERRVRELVAGTHYSSVH